MSYELETLLALSDTYKNRYASLSSNCGSGISIPSLAIDFSKYSTPTSTEMTPKERKDKVKELEKDIKESEEKVEKVEKEIKTQKETKTAEEESGKNFGVGNALKSMAKGVGNFFTNMFMEKDEKGNKHVSLSKAVVSVGIAGAAIGLTALTAVIFPPAAPFVAGALIAAGAGLSAVQVGKGVVGAFEAKTLADKDAAWQEIGEGGVGAALSFAGFKGAGAIKGIKAGQMAKGLTNATEGVVTAVKDAEVVKSTKAVGELLRNNTALTDTVAKNPDLSAALTAALKNASKDNIAKLEAELNKAGIKDLDQIVKVTDAVSAGKNAKDGELLSAIDEQIDYIKGSKLNRKEMENASKTLAELLQQTGKDGISPEVEAALARLQEESPQIRKILGLSDPKQAVTARVSKINDLPGRGRRTDLIEALEKVSAKPEDKPLIDEAVALLKNLKTNSADRELVKTLLQKISAESGSLSTTLKSQLDSAVRSLDLSLGQSAKSLGKNIFLGAYEGTVSVTKSVAKASVYPVAHPIKFTLNTGALATESLQAGIVMSQLTSSAYEDDRQKKQQKHFAEMKEAVEAKETTSKTAKKEYREKLEELAKLYKIKTEGKTDDKLKEEIDKAKEKEKEEKKVGSSK